MITPTFGLSATRRLTSLAFGWAIPGRRNLSATDMTGGAGALPMFVDFMKTFLKEKPKEEFRKGSGDAGRHEANSSASVNGS